MKKRRAWTSGARTSRRHKIEAKLAPQGGEQSPPLTSLQASRATARAPHPRGRSRRPAPRKPPQGARTKREPSPRAQATPRERGWDEESPRKEGRRDTEEKARAGRSRGSGGAGASHKSEARLAARRSRELAVNCRY